MNRRHHDNDYGGDDRGNNNNNNSNNSSNSSDDDNNLNERQQRQPQHQQQQRDHDDASNDNVNSSSASRRRRRDDADVDRNRARMTVLHYVLTYPRWSLSLFLLLAGRSLFLPSAERAVQTPLRNLRTQSRQQSDAYEQCVLHAFSTLRHRTERVAVERERRRVQAVRDRNRKRLSKIQDDADSCDAASKQSIRALRAIVGTGAAAAVSSSGTTTRTDLLLLVDENIAIDDADVDPAATIVNDDDSTTNNASTTTTTTTNNNNDKCTAVDRGTVRTLLGLDDGNGSRQNDEGGDSNNNEVESLLDAYRLSTNQAALRLIRYAQDRAEYDYNYFVGVKITSSIDLLQNFTIEPNIVLPDASEIVDALVALLQRILDALRSAYVRIDLLNVRLMDFQASIGNFYVNYLDLYARLQLASDFVRDFLPGGIPLPPYFDLSTIPVGDVLLPPIYEIPNLIPPLPNIDDLLLDYIRDAIELIQRILRDLAETIAETIRDILRELLEQLLKLLTLEDYDPPRYVGSNAEIESPSEEMEYVAELGRATQKQTVDAIAKERSDVQNAFDAVGDGGTSTTSDPDDYLNASSSSSFLDDDGSNTNTTFGYLEPEFPSFAIPPLVGAVFTFILVYQWMIELVIQLYRIYSLKRRYEREASVDLPEIDCVDDSDGNDGHSDEKQRQREGTMAMIQLTLLRHFMTPWMALGLLLFPFAILGVTVWFPHVRQTCVVSRRGTVWARNLISPLVINKANVAGNTMYVRAENQCNRRQRQICRTEYAATDLSYRRDLALWYDSEKRLNESSHIVNLFDKCISQSTIESLDELFITNCCGLEGYTEGYSDVCGAKENRTGAATNNLCPIDNTTTSSSVQLQQQQQHPLSSAFRPVSEYLNNAACQRYADAVFSLEDSRFNCTVLQEACSSGSSNSNDEATSSSRPCSTGVDDDLLRLYAIEADCQLQVYVIKCCLLVLLALYHAIIVNLFSSLAFNSIKHLCWRSLAHFQRERDSSNNGGGGGIKLRTRMAQNGELVGKGVQTADDRAKQIEATMRRFEKMGWMYLALSLALFLIWFISFFVLRRLLHEWNNA